MLIPVLKSILGLIALLFLSILTHLA